MKIIVLSLSKYKEKDCIVNAISKDEFLIFNAHGILSPSSKYAHLNNQLVIADVVLSTAKSGNLSLKESSVITSPFIMNSDLNYMVTLSLLAEATNKMLDNEEKPLAFDYLEKAIIALKKAKYPLYVGISYLAKLINLAGYSLEINRCVRCGSKQNIIAFSFDEGGYICQNCIQEDDRRDLTKEQLLLIRTLSGTQDFNFNNLEYNEDSTKFLLDKFISFINDIGGVELNSTKFINN